MNKSLLLRLVTLSLSLLLSGPVAADSDQQDWPKQPSRLKLSTPYGQLHVSQSDYVYDARLLLNGEETKPPVMGLLNIPYAFSATDYHVALISIDSGDDSCPINYKWILLESSGYDISDAFGSCSEQIRVFADNHLFTMQTPNLEQPDKIDTYIFDGETVVAQPFADS
ncbi:MAG TPA: hypothetical protein VK104_10750 [Burkholderiaceae bacterium]|nr:hypothetical protein [Burkholderiaceae bacterium]